MLCLSFTVLCMLHWLADGSLGGTFRSQHVHLIDQFDEGSLNIINGSFTNIEDHPITVAFLISNDIWGAGAIFNKEWVVTTAYNCFWVDPKYMSVRAGSSNWTAGGQLFAVERCVLHPAYNASSGENNVAMVKLRGQVAYGRAARAASAPLVRDHSGRLLANAGWGVRSKEFIKEKLLQSSNMTVWSAAQCSTKYNMTSTSICAYNPTSSPCIFDFGAPLMSRRVLVGLYAGSRDCTKPAENPALYTEVFPFKSWMENVVKQN